jgi:hypothetical protein
MVAVRGWLSDPVNDTPSTDDGTSSAAAARALAAVLVDVADAIASDDLTTVSSAMTQVRTAARRLEASLGARGWGGDVLYGWGAREDEDEDLVDDARVDGAADADDDVDSDDREGRRAIPEHAVRVTCQSRSDFYLLDQAALIEHDVRRAAELGLDWDREFVTEQGAFFCFAELWGLDSVDLTGTGLAAAGSQNATHVIEQTLWEMDDTDDELRDDAIPTAG